MAPELFQKKAYSQKVDVFAFGTMLWELYSKTIPWQGLEPDDIMQHVLKDDPLPQGTIQKSIYKLISLCRTFDPEKRPDFSEIVSTLNDPNLL